VNWKNRADPWAQLPTAIHDYRDGGREATGRLVALLASIETTGDENSGLAALRLLAETPKTVLRLDESVRRGHWSFSRSPSAIGGISEIGEQVRAGFGGPVAVALASTHWDGRVREQAVRRMLNAPVPEIMPFLLVRTNDWVREVRNPARAGLVGLLDDDPARFVPAAAGTTVLLGGRARGGFACHQLFAAIRQAPEDLRRQLATSEDRAVRRMTFDAAMSAGRLGMDELLATADQDPDILLRSRAAEAVARDAVWAKKTEALRSLTKSRHPELRALGVTGLVRIGLDQEVVSCLDDRSSLVRAHARAAAHRTGVDPLRYYREEVTADEPSYGVIAGLSEIGGEADAPLLRNLLAHRSPRIRVRALRGLRLLNAVPIAEVTELLRDPSPSVVREAMAALSRKR
jgi:HEAT repeat protein